MNEIIQWQCKKFTELTSTEIYDILQLRSAVFVVEQQCIFLDIDGIDKQSYHLFCYYKNELAACCRLIAPNIVYQDRASIGRVANAFSVRGSGIGRAMMKEAIEKCKALFSSAPLTIGAQLYLKKFYGSFGFVPCGDVYLEDGIEHIHMQLFFN